MYDTIDLSGGCSIEDVGETNLGLPTLLYCSEVAVGKNDHDSARCLLVQVSSSRVGFEFEMRCG